MLWKVITHNWPKWEVENTLGQSVNGFNKKEKENKTGSREHIAVSVDRTRDLQIFSLTLSQLSYPRFDMQVKK